MLERIEEEYFDTRGCDAKDLKVMQTGTPLVDAIEKVLAVLTSRSFVFLLSDFYVAEYQKALSVLGSRHDVVAIRLVNNSNISLKNMGTVLFHDYESFFSTVVNTSYKSSIERRRLEFKKEIDEWKQFCLTSHIHPLVLNSDDNMIQVLSQFFAIYKNYSR